MTVTTTWHEMVEILAPFVVRIWTPQGSGTGFLVSSSKKTSLCAIATAEHVIRHAHYWEEPIRIEHLASGKTVLLRQAERVIQTQPLADTAAIIFERRDLNLPTDGIQLIPKDNHFKPGVEIGWLGYPAIPKASLCFFSGHVSAWLEDDQAYLVDGVAINGVSGGPAFVPGKMLMGVVSAYIPNRATGESLPGLAVVRGVRQFHDIADQFRSFDEAKAGEKPPTEPPSSLGDGDGQTKTGNR